MPHRFTRSGLLPLVAALGVLPSAVGSTTVDVSYPVPDFTLTERSGRQVSKGDLLGKVWIASFVLIRCPDGKCPQVTQTMSRLQEELKSRTDLVLVTFTVDPDRDTPDELRHYAEAHHADPDRWLFLTGREAVIDRLLRSLYLKAGQGGKPAQDHTLRLIVVDRQGNMRGTYPGLEPATGDAAADAEFFLRDRVRLRRQVDALLAPELPSFMPADVPAFNASLNAASAALMVLGYACIRQRRVRLHAACMLSAITVSSLFLASYLYFHLVIKQGQPTRFSEQAYGAPQWVGYLYMAILGSHTILAVPAAPLALVSAYLGLRGRTLAHVRLVRWTFPIWLYVSVTGVVVYAMLYRLYPAP